MTTSMNPQTAPSGEAAYCPEPDCRDDGCGPQNPCCPGLGCVCTLGDQCPTVIAEYEDDGSVRRFCPDHKTEFCTPADPVSS